MRVPSVLLDEPLWVLMKVLDTLYVVPGFLEQALGILSGGPGVLALVQVPNSCHCLMFF